MKDIKTIRNEYNKSLTNNIYEYCKKSDLVLSNILKDQKELEKLIKILKVN